MPIKILLADKSITIQKVVEMLFSGKEYEVLCVSDGETALSEAQRVGPDVVLADIDLPRIDGYNFSSRLKQVAALSRTPVILMMSRDDVFDETRARPTAIVDHIAKPFESQELIGKVRKAVSAASPRAGEAAPAAARPAPQQPPKPAAAPSPAPAAAPVVPPAAAPAEPAARPRQAPPADIFDIIKEAPTHADLKRPAAPPPEEEGVYEVEPVVEVEEPIAREIERALPVGEKAVEEMRAGLGLAGERGETNQEIVNFESLDMATAAAQEYSPPEEAPRGRPAAPESYEPREYVPPQEPGAPEPREAMSDERLRSMVEASVAKIVREIAREVVEKVAWEVIPDLAEMLIKAEIERLKIET
jgi:CheY-like chemotaxis protein